MLFRSLVVQLVKSPPAMLETWVQSLGWEDPLEKGTATQSRSEERRVGKEYPLQYSGLENSSPWGPKESNTTE